MPLDNYSPVWWQWLVARRMSVCPLSSFGPRHTRRLEFHSTLILWVGPWICKCLTTHEFPMFNVSDENNSQLRFWESFKFSRDSRWISSWSHSFIWLLLNIERFILSCKSIIISISELPYVIQWNWYNLSFSCAYRKKERLFNVINWAVGKYLFLFNVLLNYLSLWSSPTIVTHFIKHPIMLIGVINQNQGQKLVLVQNQEGRRKNEQWTGSKSRAKV